MKNEKKGARENEPFKPQDTPKPPQDIEPHKRKQQPQHEGNQKHPDANTSGGKAHLLNEDAEIDDETTI